MIDKPVKGRKVRVLRTPCGTTASELIGRTGTIGRVRGKNSFEVEIPGEPSFRYERDRVEYVDDDPEVIICRELEQDERLRYGDIVVPQLNGKFLHPSWEITGLAGARVGSLDIQHRTVLRTLAADLLESAKVAEPKFKFNPGDKVVYTGHKDDRRGISNPGIYFARSTEYTISGSHLSDNGREWCHFYGVPWYCSPDWFELVEPKTPATITLHFDDLESANDFVEDVLESDGIQGDHSYSYGPPEPWDDIKELVGDLEINLRRLGK